MEINKHLISYLYLLISSLGAILPTIANIEFVKDYGPGFDLKCFLNLAFNNPASQSLSLDLLVVSSTIFIWMFIESKRLKIKHFWFIVLTTFSIAIAFAAPFFLFLRERRLIELEEKGYTQEIPSDT